MYKSIDRCVYYMDTLIKSLTDKQIIPKMTDRYDGLLPRKITDYQNGIDSHIAFNHLYRHAE